MGVHFFNIQAMGRKKKLDSKQEKVELSNTSEKEVITNKEYDYSKLGDWVYIEACKNSKHLVAGNKYRVGKSTALTLHKRGLINIL